MPPSSDSQPGPVPSSSALPTLMPHVPARPPSFVGPVERASQLLAVSRARVKGRESRAKQRGRAAVDRAETRCKRWLFHHLSTVRVDAAIPVRIVRSCSRIRARSRPRPRATPYGGNLAKVVRHQEAPISRTLAQVPLRQADGWRRGCGREVTECGGVADGAFGHVGRTMSLRARTDPAFGLMEAVRRAAFCWWDPAGRRQGFWFSHPWV